MKKITVVGVPEHFNLPWHLCIENNEFNEIGVDLQWIDIPEGTGKMCQMLRNNETDLAVILTEGIIKDLTKGNPSSLVQQYVSTPLLWGIHVAESSSFQNIKDLQNKRIAISRYGSGSHLMAIVHAKKMGWNTDTLNFIEVNTIEHAVEALINDKADYFMWERFMTKPLVDQKIFRQIGECPTPWPSFVIAGRQKFLQENKALVENVLEIINRTTLEFKLIPSIDRTLSERYNQKAEDIKEWLKLTSWSQKQLSPDAFSAVQNQLVELNLIEKTLDYSQAIFKM